MIIITLAVGLLMRIRNPEFAIATALVAANWIQSGIIGDTVASVIVR